MSTVDPTIARREREQRRPSNARVGVLLALLLLGGFAAGYGWGGFDAMMSSGPDEPSVLVLVAIPVGMIVTIVSLIAWMAVVLKRADLGLMYGNAAALLGAGAGVIVVATAGGGASYVLAIGFGLLGLAMACLVLGVVAAASRRRRAAAEEEAMRTGTQVTAVVTDKGYTVFHESDRILTTVTFSFTDLQGVQRWVQRTMVIEAGDPVQNGQETRLWFDAADPGDDKAIVVELAHRSQLRSPLRAAMRSR